MGEGSVWKMNDYGMMVLEVQYPYLDTGDPE